MTKQELQTLLQYDDSQQKTNGLGDKSYSLPYHGPAVARARQSAC